MITYYNVFVLVPTKGIFDIGLTGRLIKLQKRDGIVRQITIPLNQEDEITTSLDSIQLKILMKKAQDFDRMKNPCVF